MAKRNKIGLLVFAATLTLVLVGAGCAKKNKPDADANAMMDRNVTDKVMNPDVQGSDSGQIEGLSSVHFDYDKSNLTPETKRLISENVHWLKKHSKFNLEIQGHCDRHGSEEYNLALGERRAKAVMHYMVSLGVKSHRLTTISYGNERLLDTAETDEADAKNRRANFRPVETVKNSLTER